MSKNHQEPVLAIVSKDISILQKIKNVLNSNHKLYKRQAQIEPCPGNKGYMSGVRFVFRVGSKLIYNDLLNLGVIPRKSLTMLFPAVPSEFLSYFVRGYFDGNGCLYLIKNKYPRLIFTSGSNKFLVDLSNTLSCTLDIPLKVAYSQLQKSNNLCYHLNYNTKLSKRILEFMYKDLEKTPYLERKFVIYQKYLQSQK